MIIEPKIVVDNILMNLRGNLGDDRFIKREWISITYGNLRLGVIKIGIILQHHDNQFIECISISNIMLFKKYQGLGIFKELIKQISNNTIFSTRNIHVYDVINDNLSKSIEKMDNHEIVKEDNKLCYIIKNN